MGRFIVSYSLISPVCTRSAMKTLTVAFLLVGIALAQKKGAQKENVHLPMTVEVEGQAEELGIVLDSNWRWTHIPGDFKNCYTGNEWDPELCPDGATCSQNCGLDGVDDVDWERTYGVTSDGNAATL